MGRPTSHIRMENNEYAVHCECARIHFTANQQVMVGTEFGTSHMPDINTILIRGETNILTTCMRIFCHLIDDACTFSWLRPCPNLWWQGRSPHLHLDFPEQDSICWKTQPKTRFVELYETPIFLNTSGTSRCRGPAPGEQGPSSSSQVPASHCANASCATSDSEGPRNRTERAHT